MDVDWYEASVAVLSDCKIVGHIAREVARTVANFLKFKGKILQVIYAKFGGISNKTVQSLKAGGLEIGVILHFDCKSSTEAKDVKTFFCKHACHYVPRLTKQNCPEELKLYLERVNFDFGYTKEYRINK